MENGRGIPYVQVPPHPRSNAISAPRREPGRQIFAYVSVPRAEALGWKRKAEGSPGTNSSPKRRRTDDEEAASLSLANSATGDDAQDILEYTEDELDLGEDSSGSDDGIHIRTLDDFCIFEGQDMISAIQLLGPNIASREFTAMGLVKPQLLDSATDDGDDEDAQFVKDLRITELDLHHVDADGILDCNIYVKTARAWYILETPAPVYRPYFIPLQIRHSLTNDIVSASLRNAKTTYKKFAESLDPLTKKHLETIEVVDYFQSYIPIIAADVKKTTKRNLNNVPLVETLLKSDFSEHLEIEPPEVKAFVTPVVGRIIMPFVAMTVVGSNSAELGQPSANESRDNLRERDHDEPITMRWGNCLDHRGYYDSVEVDGQGDVVAVRPGMDYDAERAERATLSAEFCRNSYARRAWFIQIQYFFDDDKEKDHRGKPAKKLHGQWFAHGSDTILAEVNHSQELFLLEQCDDIYVSSIYRKCAVRKLELEEPEIPDQGEETAISYFYRYLWGTEQYDFRDPPTDEEQRRVISLLPEHTPCVNCGFVAEEALRRQLHPLGPEIPNGFTQFGYDYHPGDFVFIKPKEPEPPEPPVPTPLFIGQITAIKGLEGVLDENRIVCSIRYFERYPEDERRLYRTTKTNQVKAKDLDGVCWVKFIDQDDVDAIEDWINTDSVLYRFYTNTRESSSGDRVSVTKTDFDDQACEPCTQKHELDSEQYHLRNGTRPITCLDVFSGAGGLSAGMSQSGYLEPKWGIEHSPSAAQTFAVNHPDTKVLCADVNDILKYIVDREDGKKPTPPKSLVDGSSMSDSDIPRPGEVDFVGGGSPCQPFSGFRKFDIRSTLPYTMLGLVETLRPSFVLLENVPGLLSYYLAGDNLPSGKRVDMAALKLCCRVLMALGYQVRFKVLQAGQYGTPQDRERIIFLAAMRGHKLPEFPIPTHAFKPARRFKIPLRRNDRIRPPTCSRTEEDHPYAPHPAVTVNDAIEDMPAFEWFVESKIYVVETHAFAGSALIVSFPRRRQDVEAREQRELDGILQCKVSKIPVGFPAAVQFTKEPRTRFQKMMRRKDGLIKDHVTQAFKDSIVELTTLVPLKPWSNYRFLPKDILPAAMKRLYDSNGSSFYGRLDGTSYFKTALTEPKPNANKAHFIHPNYKRTFTLREFARSQGFPDSYTFCSTESTPAAKLKDYFKQIGNAVPLPLAAALGRSIGAAAIHDWRQRNRRESSVEC
ncbi:DNA (cytosine-5)-methyltransferase [Mycena sanguinolenta]|uniref:Cytosine-specific methyltransferase n=1 Tax=Mycena sanguinolenta TaxID=230812 RepID=A0A8H7CQH0_9AGAR|nr:DNA (cytosine-5)-methyltransferase [Mycena sanguinolenta]